VTAAGALAFAGLAGCSTTRAPSDKPNALTGAVEQPLKDLSIVREEVPPALAKAAKAPYVEIQPLDCNAVRTELAALDKELGPDFDAAQSNDDILAGALRSAMGLPFRGVVRRITGAQKRDRKREHAILAGIARRGFLKGVNRKACIAPPPLEAAREPAAGPASTPPLVTVEPPPLIPAPLPPLIPDDGQAAPPQ
jgi:hypothetical protein